MCNKYNRTLHSWTKRACLVILTQILVSEQYAFPTYVITLKRVFGCCSSFYVHTFKWVLYEIRGLCFSSKCANHEYVSALNVPSATVVVVHLHA